MGLEVAGANCPDMALVEATLASIPVERPEPTGDAPQHLCAATGYQRQRIVCACIEPAMITTERLERTPDPCQQLSIDYLHSIHDSYLQAQGA